MNESTAFDHEFFFAVLKEKWGISRPEVMEHVKAVTKKEPYIYKLEGRTPKKKKVSDDHSLTWQGAEPQLRGDRGSIRESALHFFAGFINFCHVTLSNGDQDEPLIHWYHLQVGESDGLSEDLAKLKPAIQGKEGSQSTLAAGISPFEVHENQEKAVSETLAYLRKRCDNGHAPDEITVLAHSLHTLTPLLCQIVVESLTTKLKVIAGSSLLSLLLGNQRQSHLIEASIEELRQVVKKSEPDRRKDFDLIVLRTDFPPSLKGLKIDDDFLCVSWFTTYPILDDLPKLLEDIMAKRKTNYPKKLSDRWSINGNRNPHIIIRKDANNAIQYEFFRDMFQLYCGFIEESFKRNRFNPLICDINAPELEEGACRMSRGEAIENALNDAKALRDREKEDWAGAMHDLPDGVATEDKIASILAAIGGTRRAAPADSSRRKTPGRNVKRKQN